MINLKCETVDVEKRDRSGRKRVTTKSDNRYLKHVSIHNHYASASDLKVRYEKECCVSLSAVQRYHVDCNLHAYHPKKKAITYKKKKKEA